MIPLPTDENPVVIIHGDCLDILPQIPDGVVDAVVTDPPYGIGESNKKPMCRVRPTKDWKNPKPSKYIPANWDCKPVDSKTLTLLAVSPAIIWGGNYFSMPPSPSWLVWDKRTTGDYADCELAWTNLGFAVKKFEWLWSGYKKQCQEDRFHPTQKPVALMRWCIQHLPKSANVILDPFAGSGTTGVAAILEGRKAILIEKDAGYVEVIKKRIAETLGRRTTLANGKVVGVNLFENIL